MKHFDIVKALEILRPGEAWLLTDDDYSQIQWLEKKTQAPSIEEVEAKVAELPQLKAAAEATKAAEKAAVLAKLGLNAEEVTALLS
jgi:hypothetical protein